MSSPSRTATPRRRPLRALSAAWLLGVPFAACLLACQAGVDRTHVQARDTSSAVGNGSQGAKIELLRSPERDEIAALEDRRSLGDGRLVELLAHEDAGVRARAATALGRFPFPPFGAEVTNPLSRALEDPDVEVRLAAAFALGSRTDPASGGVLMAYRNDTDPRIRARVVQAASRIDDPRIHLDLLTALRDSAPEVQIEAVLGAALWSPEETGAEDVDRALLDTLRPYTVSTGQRPRNAAAVDPELRWRLLYALARRHSTLGRGAFLEYVDSEAPLERLFAVQGLGTLEGDAESVAALARLLSDEVKRREDWRVAYEAAVSLGKIADTRGLAALLEAVEHESPHVRAAALTALGAFKRERAKILPRLRRGLLDLSTTAASAALASMVRVVEVEDALHTIEERTRNEDAIARVGAVDAAALIGDEAVVPLLQRLAGDPERLVATRAIEALGTHPSPETRTFLRSFLTHPDNGLRLAAVVALREMAEESDVEALEAAYLGSTGDVSAEVASNVLDTLAAIGGTRARALHERAAADPRPHVRRVARRNLREIFGTAIPVVPPPALDPGGPPPLAGREFKDWKNNPRVEVRTSKGVMVFELFPAEAPIHVHNFLELAKRGHYDGLTFHRVVPDFVIQGGDERGDGNGATPWRGDALRQEFTPRKYVRGSLGMPRNEDPDSGGSQFFVTHRPTPHLDGRYTIFGELRVGGEVLDRIEMGDHILGVKLLR